jgi:hypothetical protein
VANQKNAITLEESVEVTCLAVGSTIVQDF